MIPALDLWSRSGFQGPTGPAVNVVKGAVAFFAYSYPNSFSSNTGYESDNSMVTFLVQDDSCQTDTDSDGTIDSADSDCPTGKDNHEEQ